MSHSAAADDDDEPRYGFHGRTLDADEPLPRGLCASVRDSDPDTTLNANDQALYDAWCAKNHAVQIRNSEKQQRYQAAIARNNMKDITKKHRLAALRRRESTLPIKLLPVGLEPTTT